MKYFLVVPGKIRPKPLAAAFDEYFSRLEKRIGLKHVVLRDEKIDSRPRETILNAEGNRILNTLNPGDYVIVLDETGIPITTPALAEKLRRFGTLGKKRVAFVLGGALGLADSVKARADEMWRLSDLVLAGGVARIVLLEALYRADTIIRNEPYHNA